MRWLENAVKMASTEDDSTTIPSTKFGILWGKKIVLTILILFKFISIHKQYFISICVLNDQKSKKLRSQTVIYFDVWSIVSDTKTCEQVYGHISFSFFTYIQSHRYRLY